MIAPQHEPACRAESAHQERRAPHVRLPALSDHQIAELRREELERTAKKLNATIERARRA